MLENIFSSKFRVESDLDSSADSDAAVTLNLGMLLNLPTAQFPHLQNRGNNS